MPSNRYDLEILIRTRKQGSGLPETEKEVENLGKRLNSTIDTINKSVVAAAAAGATFKQAFDLAKEGAQLQFAQERFDRLSVSIGTTAEALENDLKAATGGLVADSQLIASATDIISLGLAKDQEGVTRLATVINKLGLNMQQVILTFANNSKARLDALGLSVEDVTEKAAELEAQGFEGDAFDQAVLISLEEKLDLVGDAADSDVAAFLRLEAQVQNTEDAFKSWLANGLLPVIEAVSGGYETEVTQMIDSNIEAAKSFDELVAEARKIDEAGNILGGFGTAVTGTSGAVRDGVLDITKQMAVGADSFEQFEQAIEDSFGAKSQQHLFSYIRANNLTLEEYFNLQRRVESFTARQAEETAAIQANIEALRGKTDAIVDSTAVTANAERAAAHSTEALASQSAQLNEQMERQAAVTAGAADQLARLAEHEAAAVASRARLVDAFNAAADPVNELLEAQQLLADSEGEWVQRTVTNADQLTAVNAELAADLSDDQAKAYREILKTVDEGSAEWLSAYDALQNDLTQSQRNALIAQQADLAAQPDRLVDVYTGDAEGAEEAQARITAANEAIKQSYRETAAEAILAQNGVNAATLDLLVGIGYLTQEQADARLEIATTTTAIEELTASSEFNKLTIEGQTAALNALIDGEAKSAEEAQNLGEKLDALPEDVRTAVTVSGIEDALRGVGDLLRQMDQLDGRHVSASVTVRTDSEIPDLGQGGGGKEPPKKAGGGRIFARQLFEFGEGNRPELAMFKRDGRLFGLPGSDGEVFSNQQSQGILGGQTINDNRQTIIYANSKEAAALALATAQINKRSRFNRSMGA